MASLSYCFVPSSSIEEAPIQAAWVATGVALASSLIQSIVETSTEVFHHHLFYPFRYHCD